MKSTQIFCFVFSLFCLVNCLSERVGGNRVVVILESNSIKQSHSIFFKSLEDQGYILSFFTAGDESSFKSYGEWNYDHLILFTPSSPELPKGISAKTILEFIDDGKNVLVVAGTEIGKPTRDIAADCNVEFDEEGTFVIDHFNYDVSDDGSHTLLVVDPSNIISESVVFEKPITAPILFKGIGQDIEEDSALLFSVAHASSTAYSNNPDEKVDVLHVAGKKTSLVTALQARNNARVVFSGSLELFSDSFFKANVQKQSADGKTQAVKSGNEDFAKQLVQWLFQERGILRAINVKHHRVGETVAPATYTIKEDIEYSVEIQEYRGRKWVPFVAKDVQLEFRMLDPQVRTTLTPDGKGKFSTQFKLPDVYGVFTFKIDYTRKGYGFLTSITRTPVRPFRHNEYERFIPSAYPYYASAFSMMAGLFLFSWFFLYHKESKI
eukprot:TRINITY_DN528_c0_g1_i1.p1 TRINITY_DN528_c0_g1~~TRINITY_DN528_c0_g1_i1.p1  ORF type:complete len:450 (+),score=128.01 TRINITY_DN528_c0_g1_i1:40-1350(+)